MSKSFFWNLPSVIFCPVTIIPRNILVSTGRICGIMLISAEMISAGSYDGRVQFMTSAGDTGNCSARTYQRYWARCRWTERSGGGAGRWRAWKRRKTCAWAQWESAKGARAENEETLQWRAKVQFSSVNVLQYSSPQDQAITKHTNDKTSMTWWWLVKKNRQIDWWKQWSFSSKNNKEGTTGKEMDASWRRNTFLFSGFQGSVTSEFLL